jgi:hypothetical protein
MDGGILPDYLAVCDYLVERDCRDELAGISGKTQLILDERWTSFYPPDVKPRVVWLAYDKAFEGSGSDVPEFWDPSEPDKLYGGGTVTYALLQIAFLMGFREILLLGLDHRYTIPETAEATPGGIFVSRGPDPNHFNPDYFGPGRWFHDPMVDRMEISYRSAERVLSAAGVTVRNGTPGTALTVFPLVQL